eukprot:3284893-Alexandrium_andersonii.AAC.1
MFEDGLAALQHDFPGPPIAVRDECIGGGGVVLEVLTDPDRRKLEGEVEAHVAWIGVGPPCELVTEVGGQVRND